MDVVPFLSYDELPSVLDKSVYCALLLVAPRITGEMIRYVRMIRKKKYLAPVYIVAAVPSSDTYRLLMDVPDLYIFESSTMLDVQLSHIVKSIESQCLFQYNVSPIPLKEIVESIPECAAVIDERGLLLIVNDRFIAKFGFLGAAFPVSLNAYIPDFAYEDLIRKIVYKQASTASIISNFTSPKGGIIPVEILISEPLHGDAGHVLLFRDRSEIISIKRMAEYQGRVHEDLKELVHNTLQIEQNPLLEAGFLNQVKVLFNCNQVFAFNLDWKNSPDKMQILTEHLSVDSEKFLGVFANLIEMAVKQSIPTVYHFSDENPTHAAYLAWAKTLIAIPVRSLQSSFAIVFLAFANSYEPDRSMFGLLELFSDLLAFRFSQIEYLKSRFEADKERNAGAASLDGIFKTHIDGKFLYVNQAFVELMGYNTAEEFYDGINAVDLFSNKNDRLEFINLLKSRKILRNNITRLLRKDGKEIIVLEHARLTMDPNSGLNVIEGTLREISSDIDVIKVLADSHSFSDDLIENAGVMIAAVNAEQEFMVWNKKAKMVLGYDASQVIGKKTIITRLFPDKKYRDFAMQKLNESIYDKSGLPVELVCQSIHGQKRIISWSIRRMISGKFGKINLLFGTDLTDVRRFEKRVLENQKMETISGIVEMFATRFQEVVHDISESVHELQDMPEGQDKEIFDQINAKLRDSNHLIERIMSLSTMSQNSTGETCDADQLIENSFQILRGIIPDRINLQYDLNGFSMIPLKESQFNQMIMNLTLNSVDAIDDTGEIRIESQKVRMDEDPFLQENKASRNLYLKLSFSDTGKGMDSIVKKKIFNPFFTTSVDKSRAGLGLTLIYYMINAAHGYINVESEPGKGTRIVIYLPVLESMPDVSKTINKSEEICILVVDDQLYIRELLKDILSSKGYRVLLADDGLSGLEMYKLHQDEIDLVILDIIMPKLNGDEVYTRLKEIDPNIKVIVTSGFVQPDVIQKLKKLGINGYIKKPFEIQTVQKQLDNILGA